MALTNQRELCNVQKLNFYISLCTITCIKFENNIEHCIIKLIDYSGTYLKSTIM